MNQPKQGAAPVPDQGWVQWTNSGKMYMSKKEKNVFIFEGVNMRGFSAVEFRGSEAERTILKSDNWSLLCELKVAPCEMCPKQDVSIILDVVSADVLSSACDFLAVRVNGSNREIRVENYGPKSSAMTLFSSPNLATLRQANYFNLRITGGTDCIHSLSLNGVTLTQNIPFRRSNAPTSAIGISCYGKTRALVRRFKIEEGISSSQAPMTQSLVKSTSALVKYAPTMGYNFSGYDRSNCSSSQNDDLELMALIERDIIVDDLQVSIDDIGGLETAKRALKEAVMLPLLMPDIFTGIRKPWHGVLLFGPPGTGKTMLAKAIASIALDNATTFFNCSVATLTSKWRGESEKLLRALFTLAQERERSILFFDEVDSLLSHRGGPSEHEASRRFKSEFLIHMDGLLSDKPGSADKRPFVLCTSNAPWDIDEALRRRLEKRVFIPLPDIESRKQMVDLLLQEIDVADDIDAVNVAQLTEGYSGSDLRMLMREASMVGLRKMIDGLSPREIKHLRDSDELNPPKVTQDDIEGALQSIQPSVSQMDVARFEEWAAEFGST